MGLLITTFLQHMSKVPALTLKTPCFRAPEGPGWIFVPGGFLAVEGGGSGLGLRV